MRFKRVFTDLIRQANRKIGEKASLRKYLKPYVGRKLVLNVSGDASYRFNIGPKGISLETGKRLRPTPTDMYLKMSKDRVERLILRKQLRLMDLPSIEHRNITMREVILAKEIHRRYLSRTAPRRRAKPK